MNEDGLERRWKQRRGARWRTYDAKHFDEWTAAKERSPSKQHRIRAVARQTVWFAWLHAKEFYDTYEHALAPGFVDSAGLCLTCNGRRRPKQCRCDDHTPSKDDSPGMLRWREVDQGRRRPAVVIEETDETPAVAVDLVDVCS